MGFKLQWHNSFGRKRDLSSKEKNSGFPASLLRDDEDETEVPISQDVEKDGRDDVAQAKVPPPPEETREEKAE